MSSFAVKLQCPNPDCLYTENPIGQPVCVRCQNQLTYRYLWAVREQQAEPQKRQSSPDQPVPCSFGRQSGESSTNIADTEIGTLIDCRYVALSPQIWLDTQPGLPTRPPAQISPQAAVYLKLSAHQLHLPQLYAIHQPDPNQPALLLLDHGPIQQGPIQAAKKQAAKKQAEQAENQAENQNGGQLQPRLHQVWAEATAVRQLNWLEQMLQLWPLLREQGVAASLLDPDNLHGEGWRLRLRELVGLPVEAALPVLVGSGARPAPRQSTQNPASSPTLADLGQLWSGWVETAQPQIRHLVRHLAELLIDPDSELDAVAEELNQYLLAQAAELPLQVETAGATSTGPQRHHNEDACYPCGEPARLPGVAIVCDGIGGHAGGEVASQLALRSLQLQLRTWLAEVVTHTEPLAPTVIEQHLVRIVRVANNLIAAQNDGQGRAQRQRMGTTLTLAVQLPKTHWTETSNGNTHELYLVHVGDSRAYWLTTSACQQLTVDDDVANRETQTGRSLLAHCRRPDASALTQALGTHEADQLKISVQRLVIDEDGVLLLCSDGLSDHSLVERHWQEIMLPVLQDRIALSSAVQSWIELADRHNGHDNSSVVLMQCRVQAAKSQLRFNPRPAESGQTGQADPADTHLTESAKALLYDESEPTPRATVLPKRRAASANQAKSIDTWVLAMGIASMTFVLGALGVAVWRELVPEPSPNQPAQAEPTQAEPIQPEPIQPESAQPAQPEAVQSEIQPAPLESPPDQSLPASPDQAAPLAGE